MGNMIDIIADDHPESCATSSTIPISHSTIITDKYFKIGVPVLHLVNTKYDGSHIELINGWEMRGIIDSDVAKRLQKMYEEKNEHYSNAIAIINLKDWNHVNYCVGTYDKDDCSDTESESSYGLSSQCSYYSSDEQDPQWFVDGGGKIMERIDCENPDIYSKIPKCDKTLSSSDLDTIITDELKRINPEVGEFISSFVETLQIVVCDNNMPGKIFRTHSRHSKVCIVTITDGYIYRYDGVNEYTNFEDLPANGLAN